MSYGIPVFDLNEIKCLSTYIDSADEIDENMQMIKGGGAALTQEKILAYVAKKFICIIDQTKQVKTLGKFPLPIEIIPAAKNYLCSKITKLGGIPKVRNGVITDNGNMILDVYNLMIKSASYLEQKINSFPGVVTVGLFTMRKADITLISTINGIKKIFAFNNS